MKWDSPSGRFGCKQPHFESTREPNHWLTLSAFAKQNRRRWDSNPRNTFVFTRFPSVLHRPLGHSSRKIDRVYCHRPQTLNWTLRDKAQSKLCVPNEDALPLVAPCGKGDEEDRLGKVAASPNTKFEADGSTARLPQF
jgi:hypothetical protein